MVKMSRKELSKITGFCQNYISKLRNRGLTDEQIMHYEPDNNHGNKGDWDDLPRRSSRDAENILREIPCPTRFDEMFG